MPSQNSTSEHDPKPLAIAITGLSIRAPGDVKTDDEFWKFVSRAQSAWSPIPTSRFTAESYHHPNAETLGTFSSAGGYFLHDDPALFDSSFFALTVEEATAMDPQQRLLLECAYEALENAGTSKALLADSNVGVFAGGTNCDYEIQNMRDSQRIPHYAVHGTAVSFLANRISHFFDFKGPSMTIDTACSSSLTALHVACESLRHGESSHALVGACHLNLIPETFISFSSSRLLGPSGKCHSFDHRSVSGYGRGEGAGCVFLRPLDDALAAGDSIRGVIVSTGVAQDGRTPGISMPSSEAQERLIRSVYARAGVNPDQTGYVEAHGTGTKVGDPAEAKALYNVFGKSRTAKSPLLIGSVKSNFGHAEGASGILSLVKTALMLERGLILPNANLEKPRDDIPWKDWNLRVPTKLTMWPSNRPYASINNFGLGGANSHVLLGKPEDFKKDAANGDTSHVDTFLPLNRRIYVLSGNSSEALTRIAQQLEVYLEKHPDVYDTHLMPNLAHTLARRTMLPWRLAVAAETSIELMSGLMQGAHQPHRATSEPTLAFTFTGQGAQWHAMGRALLGSYPVFAAAIQRADEMLARFGADFTIAGELMKEKHVSQMSLPHISQSACTALQIGLVDLLRSWNITPRAVIGHSSGEVAAAYSAGILSPKDAMKVAYYRGVAAHRLQQDFPHIKGAMMVIGATAAEVEELIRQLNGGTISIACYNSLQNVTVSGDADVIDKLCGIASEKGFFNRKLNVDIAYHSAHIALVADLYLNHIRDISPQDSPTPFYSSTRAQMQDPGGLGPSYWVENLVSSVRYVGGLSNLLESEKARGEPVQLVLEVGPHPALASATTDIIQSVGHSPPPQYLSSLKRGTDDIIRMQNLVLSLMVHGCPVNLDQINYPIELKSIKPSLLKDLPRYPWDHSRRYWHTTRIASNHAFKPFSRHYLLGLLSDEFNDQQPQWRSIIRDDDLPWLQDHRIHGRITVPMTAFLVMAMEAARQYAVMIKVDFDTFRFRDVTMGKMLTLPDAATVELSTSLRPHSQGMWNGWEVVILSWMDGRGWHINFKCLIAAEMLYPPNPVNDTWHSANARLMQELASMKNVCTEPASPESFYSDLHAKGFDYERLFRGSGGGCTSKSRRDAIMRVIVPQADEGAQGPHPALLDVFLQAIWLTLGAGNNELRTLAVPSHIKELSVCRDLVVQEGTIFQCHAKRRSPQSLRSPMKSDLWVIAAEKPARPLVEGRGLTVIPIQDELLPSESQRDLCYRVQMEPCFDFLDSRQVQRLCDTSERVISAETLMPEPMCEGSVGYDHAATCIRIMMKQRQNLRILHFGHSLDSAAQILRSIPADAELQRYVFADTSEDAQQSQTNVLGEWASRVQVQRLDWSVDIQKQIFEKRSFDVIIMSDPMSLRMVGAGIMPYFHKLLAFGGKLILIGLTTEEARLPKPANGTVEKEPSAFPKEQLLQNEWDLILKQNGFTGVDLLLGWNTQDLEPSGTIVTSSLRQQMQPCHPATVVHNGDIDISWLAQLSAAVEHLTGSTPDVQHIATVIPDGKLCIFLGELMSPMLNNMSPDMFKAIHTLMLRSSGILWVTRDAHVGCKNPEANLITGLSRTLRSETDIPFVILDIDEAGANDPSLVASVLKRSFYQPSVLCRGDFEFSARNGIVSVPRIIPDVSLNAALVCTSSGDAGELQPVNQRGRPLRLAIQDYGMLDSLYFTDYPESSPILPDDWIKIEVQCVGLNFRDIMHANNQIPVDGFGVECSGTVIATGNSVADFKVGDRVCALVDCCFSTWTSCPAACAWRVNPDMSFEEAASIPVVFTTAIYSLMQIGGLQSNETVLIHAAAGGVGQAAVMVAQATGAEVYATVGSKEKKEFLIKEYGIPEANIFFSRDASFVDGVLAATQGRGVDLLLNCLSGELLQCSMNCVAQFGRFIEIGKRDISINSRLDMAPFANNITFSAVDLSVLTRDRPSTMKKLLARTFELLRVGQIHPIRPLNIFDVGDTSNAFRLLQSGHSMGKVIVQLTPASRVTVIPACNQTRFLDGNATHMVVGGTGGLGRSIVTWLSAHGATNILLVSRSGPNSPQIQQLIEDMKSSSVTVRALGCDVTDLEQINTILKPILKASPPLRGVIHGAMVLRDASFENLKLEDYAAVLKPKVNSVYYLNQLFTDLNCSLSFSIALSSVSGIIGNRGQSAYAAASTFLDAFSEYSKAKGVPFTTIDLAPLWAIGYLSTDPSKREIVKSQVGDDGLQEQEFHDILTATIHPQANTPPNSHILTGMSMSAKREAFWNGDARFSRLLHSTRDDAVHTTRQSVGQRLGRAESLDDALTIITGALTEKISSMMLRPASEIDISTALSKYSFDSLSAIEVRKWISREFESLLQILEILTSPSLTELARIVLSKSRLVPIGQKSEWELDRVCAQE